MHLPSRPEARTLPRISFRVSSEALCSMVVVNSKASDWECVPAASSGPSSSASVISNESVNYHFDPEDGQPGDSGSSHESLGSVDAAGDSRGHCADDCGNERDREGTPEHDPIAGRGTTFGARMDWWSISIPMDKPDENQQKTKGGTDVLKDPEPRPGAEHGQRDFLPEKMPVAVEPVVVVSEGIPEDMGCNPHEKRQQDHRQTRKGFDGERFWTYFESGSGTIGKAGGQGFLGEVVKEPERDKTNRKVEFENPWQGMAQPIMGRKRDEVFRVRCEAAENHCGKNKACTPEG